MTDAPSARRSADASAGYVLACAVDEVADETALAVTVAGEDLAIVRSAGQFFAIRDECSHAAIPLSDGDVGDCEIECYMHGSRFDLRTGQPLGLPATEPVPVYPVQIVDGQVLVDVDHPSGS